MPRRFVPKTKFNDDLPAKEQQVEDFIDEYYTNNDVGPTFEQIRDGIKLDNDLVTYILRKMAEDATKILVISA